jgi:hypothetical protein
MICSEYACGDEGRLYFGLEVHKCWGVKRLWCQEISRLFFRTVCIFGDESKD